MIHVTFAGHRNVFNSGAVRGRVDAAIASILTKDMEFYFYSGGMGEFDKLCESAVRQAKADHKELEIKLVYVSPYMRNSFNTQRDYYEYYYDDVLIPMELAEAHYKGAITKRNRWMVDHADYLIAYIHRDHGGAYTTLRYAERKKTCRIIHVG